MNHTAKIAILLKYRVYFLLHYACFPVTTCKILKKRHVFYSSSDFTAKDSIKLTTKRHIIDYLQYKIITQNVFILFTVRNVTKMVDF